MKQRITKFGILALLIVLSATIFYSCKKDNGNYTPAGPQFSNTEMTKATFLGQVLKEDGSPLEGATITTSTHMMTTDADGFFYFSDISTPKNATLIKVEKAGYFNAFRTISVIPGQDNQVRIMAMELPIAKTFNASTSGTITIDNGGSIDFPANAIVDEVSNQPYTGNVSVYAINLDPTADEFFQSRIGDNRGINVAGEAKALSTYGTQGVELRGDNGQKLQLANGQTANISFPIPTSLMGDAPSSISLCHFDEVQGIWVEEGMAQRNGFEYQGEVSHFSYWFVGVPGALVNFTCTLVDVNNNPIPGAIVEIGTNQSIGGLFGLSNNNGIVQGAVTANVNATLYVRTDCNSNQIYSQNFTVLNSAINLGTISITNNYTPAVVTGIVHDCNNTVLANVPVKLNTGGLYPISTISNASGQFTLFYNCLNSSTQSTVTAYDVNNAVNGSSMVTMSPGLTTNAGIIQACGAQMDFITLNVTNPPATTPTTYTIIEPAANFFQYYNNLQTTIYSMDNTTNPITPLFCNFFFDGPQTVAGTHNLVYYKESIDSTAAFNPTIVNLSSYGPVGSKISGNFTTTATGNVYNNATVNCNFRVTRQQ